MKKAIIYLIEFLAIQLIGGWIVGAVWMLVTKSPDTTTAMIITTTVVTSVAIIAVFLLAHWTELSPRWLRTRPWMVLSWSVVAAVGALIPSMWLQEQIPELPNWLDNEFDTGNLDTRTSYEIMSLFQDLHNQGKTIAFVTHEPDIATFTTRKIKLRDGQIIEDAPINTQSAADALAALNLQKEE